MDTRKELLDGLKSTPKYIPSWYRYDKEGSRLNDMCLQENENYYFHRCELNVLKAHLSSMLTFDTEKTDLVDMGSGNCQKTRLFIDNILQSHDKLTFYPVDISHEFLSDTCRQLSEEYAEKLEIKPIPADYETGISEIRACIHPKLILWFGSIQSLEPDDQIRKLQLLRSTMTERCCLIFSIDITQNREEVMKAYNDVHARQMFMNSIWRLIREENCTIKPEYFDLEVDFIKEDSPEEISSVQVLLRAKQANAFILPTLGITADLTEGEPLYLHGGPGISHKYNLQQVQTLVQRAGLHLVDTWVDGEEHVMFCKCKVI